MISGVGGSGVIFNYGGIILVYIVFLSSWTFHLCDLSFSCLRLRHGFFSGGYMLNVALRASLALLNLVLYQYQSTSNKLYMNPVTHQ